MQLDTERMTQPKEGGFNYFFFFLSLTVLRSEPLRWELLFSWIKSAVFDSIKLNSPFEATVPISK